MADNFEAILRDPQVSITETESEEEEDKTL